jgi:hypothetical protein
LNSLSGMPVDISKIFYANVKAIRMSLSDESEKSNILNDHLLKKQINLTKKNNPIEKLFSQDARMIVSILTKIFLFLTYQGKSELFGMNLTKLNSSI